MKDVRKASRSDMIPGIIIASLKASEEKQAVIRRLSVMYEAVPVTIKCILKMTFQQIKLP